MTFLKWAQTMGLIERFTQTRDSLTRMSHSLKQLVEDGKYTTAARAGAAYTNYLAVAIVRIMLLNHSLMRNNHLSGAKQLEPFIRSYFTLWSDRSSWLAQLNRGLGTSSTPSTLTIKSDKPSISFLLSLPVDTLERVVTVITSETEATSAEVINTLATLTNLQVMTGSGVVVQPRIVLDLTNRVVWKTFGESSPSESILLDSPETVY